MESLVLLLATYYPDSHSVRRIASDARIDLRNVSLGANSADHWFAVLEAAKQKNRLSILLSIVRREYDPVPQEFHDAVYEYYDRYTQELGDRLGVVIGDQSTDSDIEYRAWVAEAIDSSRQELLQHQNYLRLEFQKQINEIIDCIRVPRERWIFYGFAMFCIVSVPVLLVQEFRQFLGFSVTGAYISAVALMLFCLILFYLTRSRCERDTDSAPRLNRAMSILFMLIPLFRK